jgi:formylmethanofuran dehydrogenase subunit C
MLTLTLKESLTVPLEAECLSPDVLAALAREATTALPVMLGKRQHQLGDFFAIEGEPGEEIEIRGDASKVKWIGRDMTRGRIRIVGNAGMHLGAYMKGGTIEVTGNAGDWVGGEMSGGLIHVRGSAGGQLGSAYRGSASGMSGGTILVEGSAGIELGMRMKRGLIAVRGPVRDFAGLQMKGGTILLMGGAELRTGAWMQRGTIIALKPVKPLPTFSFACTYRPSFLSIYAKHLKTLGFELPTAGMYRRFIGDAAVPGKGELLVWDPSPAH